jgi:hypothetical protein
VGDVRGLDGMPSGVPLGCAGVPVRLGGYLGSGSVDWGPLYVGDLSLPAGMGGPEFGFEDDNEVVLNRISNLTGGCKSPPPAPWVDCDSGLRRVGGVLALELIRSRSGLGRGGCCWAGGGMTLGGDGDVAGEGEATRPLSLSGRRDWTFCWEMDGFGRVGATGAGAQVCSVSSERGTGWLQFEHFTLGSSWDIRPGSFAGANIVAIGKL